VEHLLTAVAASRGSGIYGELLRALGDALRAAGRPDAWARCAEEELRVLDPDAPVLSDRRRLLRRDLAVAYERELGRPGDALRHLRALVKLKWTETHGAGTEELDTIENTLLGLLRAEENWVELENRLAAHVERRPDDPDRWLELARLREERLRTPVAAAEAYRAVLERRPDDVTAIRGQRRCAELVGDWEAVAGALELELERGGDLSARERSALLRRLGDVFWHRLESTTRASRSYASALEASSQDFESLHSLQRLLEAMEDWRGALDLYESETVMLGDREPERRREASLRAGEIARDHTDEPERALRAYVYAAEISELPAARRAELAELYRCNGDGKSFAEEFASWCDDPTAGAAAADHARLAEVLEELERDDAALERIERALTLDGESAPAWDAAARLRERCGDAMGAAEALERAAAVLPDGEAAPHLLRAAELSEPRDAEKAETLLRTAARCDPGDPVISAALARVCAALGDCAEAMEMAERTIDLDAADSRLDPQLRFETALIGARAAGERGNGEAAARFYAEALAVVPDHANALAEYGETLAGLGDLPAARAAIEARLAMDAADERRALHLAMLGAALEEAGEREAARERLEEAIAEDPELDRAHEELIRLHEKADRVDEGVACLERWADAASEPGERARRLLRAAEWEIRTEEHAEAAERHLREALEAGPELARAWEALATLLWDQERGDDALEVASLALEGATDPGARGCLALIRGRALEQRGEHREAAEAFAIAARENPRCIEAALSGARLLRGLGEWQGAAETLREFADRHPGDDVTGLADVVQQLGRLLAGPLEDVDGAILAYRRAIALDPERIDTRAALAEFLSHRPDDRDEALTHHQALLEADPTHAPSLRVLMRIARERGNVAAIAGGLEILRALGIASPHEREEELPDAPPTFAGNRELADPLWEKLRRIANEASQEIATALGASEISSVAPSEDPVSAFRAAALAAESQLTASALIPLREQELAEVLKFVSALALHPDQVQGDGHLLNAMSSAIRRRARRRLRRILGGESLEAIAEVDFAAWRTEVRALAVAIALDETGGDLRTALGVLISEESDHAVLDLPDGADLTPYVAAYPQARALLRRVVRTWLQSL
jgi:tetratricopeptide (TPR) repeat protein